MAKATMAISNTRTLLATVILLALTWTSAPARADVVMPPPKSCFEGSRPATGHAGPHCRAALCKDDSACKDGKTCQSRKLCLHEIPAGGRGGRDRTITVVAGLCPDGKTCSKGSCKELKVCANKPGVKKPEAKKPEAKKPEAKKATSKAAGASTTPESKGGKKKSSGCSAAGELRSMQLFPLALLLLVAALRGRSRRED